MSKLRVRLRLNEGGEGVPLVQLIGVAEEAEKFFRYLAEDVGIRVPRQAWLARNFDESASVAFDTDAGIPITEDQAKSFNAGLQFIAALDPANPKLNGTVARRTVSQYAKIGERIQPHEKVVFGFYRPSDEEPYRWHSLSYMSALLLKERLDEEVTYTGTLHGIVHSLTLEGDLWFSLRVRRTGDLIHCNMSTEVYDRLVEIIAFPDRPIYVRGRIRSRRIDRAVLSVDVGQVTPAPAFPQERYEAFFGSDPGYTGERSTEDAVEEARDYDA